MTQASSEPTPPLKGKGFYGLLTNVLEMPAREVPWLPGSLGPSPLLPRTSTDTTTDKGIRMQSNHQRILEFHRLTAYLDKP